MCSFPVLVFSAALRQHFQPQALQECMGLCTRLLFPRGKLGGHTFGYKWQAKRTNTSNTEKMSLESANTEEHGVSKFPNALGRPPETVASSLRSHKDKLKKQCGGLCSFQYGYDFKPALRRSSNSKTAHIITFFFCCILLTQ